MNQPFPPKKHPTKIRQKTKKDKMEQCFSRHGHERQGRTVICGREQTEEAGPPMASADLQGEFPDYSTGKGSVSGARRSPWLKESLNGDRDRSLQTKVALVHSTEHWRGESHPEGVPRRCTVCPSTVHAAEETCPVWERNHQEGLAGTVPGAHTGPGTVFVPTNQTEKSSGLRSGESLTPD